MAEARTADLQPQRARLVPGHATPLVGRRFVLEQLDLAVSRSFATVLWGIAGIGKSRLAHAFAAQWWDARNEGDTWVVDLASATDSTSALALIAATLTNGAGSSDPMSLVRRMLARREPTLLVLDHCEQLANSLDEWVESWSTDGPGRVLATSRVAAKRASNFEVPALSEDEALRLMEQRARRVRDSFRIDAATRDDLRRLVRQVDALPGALELLAPRLMLLSPADLAERLDRGPGSLHAAIQRSWDLLEPIEQTALRQLATTRQGFDLELAERVLDIEGDPLSVLESLTRHAWLHVVEGEDVRMQLLHEPQRFVRALGIDEAAQVRHVDAMVELGERWDAGIESADERACTRRLTENLPNLWAAWEVATDAERARLALVLHLALQRAGGPERQSELTSEAIMLAEAAGNDPLLGRALLARARVLRWSGNLAESMSTLERSLTLGDCATRCGALRNLAAGAYATGDLEASRRWADEALRLAIEEGALNDEVNARNGLGFLLSATGDIEGARKQLQRALELASQPGEPDGLFALVSSSMAGLAVRTERWLDAEFHSSQALAVYQKLGYQRHVPLELLYRAEARLAAGRLTAAAEDITAARTLARHWAYDALGLRCLYLEGICAIAGDEPARAIEALAAAANRLATREDAALALDVGLATAIARLMAGEKELAAQALAGLDDPDAQWLLEYAMGNGPLPHRPQEPLRRVCFEKLTTQDATLTVDSEGRGFQWSSGEHVDLTRRRALRGILEALAARHRSDALTLEEIMEAGWPGEVMTVDSGNRRVYVTIKRLRDLGLGEALLTVGDGYMLDPNIPILRA